nr:hypothetical protein [Escherichia coli]
MGKTLGEYIQLRRVTRAAVLLRLTKLSINSVLNDFYMTPSKHLLESLKNILVILLYNIVRWYMVFFKK